MTLSEFNLKTFDRGNKFHMKPKIVCNDGFMMSVQGSNFHYCSPRNVEKDYFEMEIGYPSEIEDLILPYCEDNSDPKETVYAYVPVDIIQQVITKHGGINIEVTFKDTL